ncbi:MAG: DUF4906 domain-containing protein [Bacteroidales bacterium]|nr:DUF4906 domain-containing protein [Bacteroidales bacterium]
MRRFLPYIAALLIFSCVNEAEPELSGAADGEEVDFELSFGAPAQDTFEIGAKSTLDLAKESKVWNLYVFIFEGSGRKLYSHFFDENNLDAGTGSDWWTVSNSENTTGTVHLHTVSKEGCLIYGIANIDADMVNISPELLSTVQSVNDLNAMVATLNQNITSRNGYFPMTGTVVDINTKRQVRVSTQAPNDDNVLRLCRLDAKIFFNIRVASPNEDRDGDIITAAVASSKYGMSQAQAIEQYGCKIGGFTPGKWYVVNIPKKAYVIENGEYGETNRSKIKNAAQSASDYFNTVPTNFDAAKRQDSHPYYSGSTQNEIYVHPFSFYMMENRLAQKSTPAGGWTYAAREKQTKSAIGGGLYENGDFVYAPDLGTYVVFSGRIIKDNITYGTTVGATLNAEPTYVVHLGDFATNLNNFDVFRNHSYTYNITIFDVDDIRVEVENNYDSSLTQEEKLAENEPGAAGSVTVSLEEIFTSDCHYSSHVITFHAQNIKEDNVTWYVKTPFNPDGKKPLRIPDENGVEHDVTSGIDFEWVEFRVNERHLDTSTDPPSFQYWKEERQVYKPHDGVYSDGNTLNVSELVEYLKRQKQRYVLGIANDFDNGKLSDGTDDPNGPKICITAFINEFYYEKDPRDGSYSRDLWKKAINQPMREMHILSDTKQSADQKSQEIGASFTIQQMSIQSVYNMDNPELMSAWGSEHFDDPLESNDGSGESTWYSKGDVINSGQKRGNDSMTNGRLNTAYEWGIYGRYNDYSSIVGSTATSSAFGVAEWSTYLNLTANNETPLMLGEYQALRYSCMSRNRDNNGNGKIDEDELRWYMGATNQLYGLYLGDYGIEGTAKLYQRNATEQASAAPKWNQHVLSSTRNYESGSSDGRAVVNTGKNGPRCIWAEEGVTGSDMARSAQYNEKVTRFTTRCLRNLGYDEASTNSPESRKDFTYSPLDHEPVNYIRATRKKKESGTYIDYPVPASGNTNPYARDVYYEFDCTFLNKASRRYYTSMELDMTDEFSEAAMLPDYLRMAALEDIPVFSTQFNVDKMNEFLNEHIGQNPYCPPGFRVPNIRELVLIRYFLPERQATVEGTVWTSSICGFARNYWYFGERGINKRGSADRDVWGWAVNKEKIQMAHRNGQPAYQIRCVKDVNPDDPNDIY